MQTIISEYKQLDKMPDGLIIIDSSCMAHYIYQQLLPSYTEVKECLCIYIFIYI
jgi:hypothetical protein